jgi:hypothetical protein
MLKKEIMEEMKQLLLIVLCTLVLGVAPQVFSADAASFEQTPAAERKEGTVYKTQDGREIYWPKAFVSSEDIYKGRVHATPMDRRADVTPRFEGFAKERLRPAPAPGVHPRVLITPGDVEQIRENVAKGDAAPRNFRMTWDLFKRDAGVDPKTGKIAKVDQKKESGPSWMEEWTFTRQALYALITQDDALGKELAGILAQRAVEGREWVDHHVKGLHPAEAESFWAAFQPKHSWLMQFAQEYDYLHGFMTEEQRKTVRDFIAHLVRGRHSHGFELPANKHIINHEIMAWKWLMLPMAIEGEPGFDEGKYSPAKVLEFGREKFKEVNEWYISPSGVMYENVKGHMPKSLLLALARRDGGATLAHPHILNAADYTAFTVRNTRSSDVNWSRTPIRSRDAREKAFWDPTNPESRFLSIGGGQFGGSFDPWVLSYLYPRNKSLDLVFKSYNTMMNYDFWDKDQNTWIRELNDSAIHLWAAHDGITGADGAPINWNTTPIDFEDRLTFSDPERGVVEMAAGWEPDALRTRVESRSDAYTGGHESPEFGNFTVSADGVSWAPYQGPYQPVIARNVVTINGFAGKYPPVPTRFIGLFDTKDAAAVVLDYAEALQFSQPGKTWFIESPSLKTTFHKWMAPWSGWDFDRNMQLPFMPHLRWLNEGKSGTDFSHWDGQNPWPQYFQRVLPPVEKAWRTIGLVRGENPYLLIVDDVQMDDQLQDYRWNFNLQREMALVRQEDDNTFIIGRGDVPWERTGSGPGGYANSGLNWKRTPKKGEPLLLVKVLNVKTETELPKPAFEYSVTWPRIVVPARTKSPDYRVLIFPFREGDPLPVTTWSEDKSRLTIRVGEQSDQFDFQQADGGRSLYTLTRNGKVVQRIDGVPVRPTLAGMPPVHRGTRYDRSGAELGPAPQTPDAAPVPALKFVENAELKFSDIPSGMDVRYTLDGREPDEQSTRYEGPVTIDRTATVKARTFARDWPFGENASPVVEARFVKQAPIVSDQLPVTAYQLGRGLTCKVYEIFTAEWDQRGHFRGDLNMLPDTAAYEPILTVATEGFELPPVNPQRSAREQFKGFYQFTGLIDVPEAGIYTFRLKSMAPVVLNVGGEKVIEETGPYHQDLKERFGQVALAAGLVSVDLVVCDQAFWRLQQLGAMPFAVEWSRDNGRTFIAVPTRADTALLAEHQTNPFAPTAGELALLPAVKAETERGLLLKTYDRIALAEWDDYRRSKKPAKPGLMALDGLKPIAVERADDLLTGSDFDGELKVYEGYYLAPFEGLYEFRLDGAGNNALWLHGQPVVANNVPDLQGTGRARLAAGLHPIRIAFGRSAGGLRVKIPANEEDVPVSFADLRRDKNAPASAGAEDWLILAMPMKDTKTLTSAMGVAEVAVHPSVNAVEDSEKGKVFEFDGTGGITLDSAPAVRNAWTLSFWMRRDSDDEMPILTPLLVMQAAGGVSSSSDATKVAWSRGGLVTQVTRKPGTFVPLVREIPVGEWFHVQVTADETVTIYINGQKRASQYYDPMAGSHWFMDYRRSPKFEFFNGFKGRVSDLKFWNGIVPPPAGEAQRL